MMPTSQNYCVMCFTFLSETFLFKTQELENNLKDTQNKVVYQLHSHHEDH